MFLEFKHGGHALAKGPGETAAASASPAGGERSGMVTPPQTGEDFDPDSMTPFRYLIHEVGPDDLLPVGQATVDALDALGAAMIEQPTDPTDSAIPPIYTYWAQ